MNPKLATALAALALTAPLLTACGNSGSTPERSPEKPTSAPHKAPTTAPAAPACDSLVGLPTSEVEKAVDTGCSSNGTGSADTWFATASYDCPDGSKLIWNDYGWGRSDDNWQAHNRSDGQLVPPDAELSECNV